MWIASAFKQPLGRPGFTVWWVGGLTFPPCGRHKKCYFVKGRFGRELMVIDFLGGGNSNIFHVHPEPWGR